jgi:hypothetical protein
MVSRTKSILNIAAAIIKDKLHMVPSFVVAEHFEERIAQRFLDEDLPLLEKTIATVFSKGVKEGASGKVVRYTHPLYHVTVVWEFVGKNGLKLITCWIKEEDAECI